MMPVLEERCIVILSTRWYMSCGKLSCMAHFEVSYGSRDQLLACRGARATSEAEKVPRLQETALRRRELLWEGLEGGHLLELMFVFGERVVVS